MLNKKEIEGMNAMRAQYEVFKESFLSTTSDFSFYNSIEGSENSSWLMGSVDYVMAAAKGDIAKTGWISCNKDSDCYGEINMYYSSLMDKIKRLSQELGLDNSLEISNLFSYLLWNGYFSKIKSNMLTNKGNKGIYSLKYADIIDGKSSQFSNSEMLKDLLNSCDLSATIMFNTTSVKNKFDIIYKLPIEREIAQVSIKDKIKSFVSTPITKKIGNSTSVLIREKDKVYIYDPTKLALFEVVNAFDANLINGLGTTKLHPYMSFLYLKDVVREIMAIDGLFELSDLSSPYSREDIFFTSEANIETFKKNIYLLDDFYADTDEERIKISKISDQLMKVRKRK